MSNPQFTESNLRSLLEAIQTRASSFADHLYRTGEQRPIYLRFDIDDDPAKAYRMSLILNEYGIKGTFFILNTAKYWNEQPEMYWGTINNTKLSIDFWSALIEMQTKGHEIAWHNNAITDHYHSNPHDGYPMDFTMEEIISEPLKELRDHGLNIIGSASHGDPLCRKLGFINYDIFKECLRTSEAVGFPDCSFDHPRLKMADFGLEYEAYHVPYDLYLSESGGREWTWRAPDLGAARSTPMEHIIGNLKNYDRIQILIHPQHWKI